MKQLFIFFFTILACSTPSRTKSDQIVASESTKHEKIETGTDINPQIAVDFINSYIDNLDKMGAAIEISEWTLTSKLVTDDFTTALEKMVAEAYEREPEYGLGFDPILDAQDYPNGGFKLLRFNEATGLATVDGVEKEKFHINIKLVSQNGRTLVDGCGAINLPEELRLER